MAINLTYSDSMAEKNKKSTSKKPTLKDQIKSLNNDIESEKDKYLRLFAEFENFRKRTSKERIELFKTASKELMSALLPVLDDMERAMKEFEKDNSADYTGFKLIYNKFYDILVSNGLSKIEVSEGTIFDAEKHEAITQIKAPSKKMVGKIIDVVENGYLIGDKILRYPKVVVGN